MKTRYDITVSLDDVRNQYDGVKADFRDLYKASYTLCRMAYRYKVSASYVIKDSETGIVLLKMYTRKNLGNPFIRVSKFCFYGGKDGYLLKKRIL